MSASTDKVHDVLIVGSGVSGSFMAHELVEAGFDCLVIEAGKHFRADTYPTNELDANAQLYWSGGVELNRDANLAFLRPKCVGGGSVVNQALLDRFPDDVWDEWRSVTGLDFLSGETLTVYYQRAEEKLSIQEIPERHWNRNALIFRDGFEANGFRWGRLRRAQRDCRYDDGNDCIACLGGCPIDSKQSMPVTVLGRALHAGLSLVSECEVQRIEKRRDLWEATGIDKTGTRRFRARRLVLAAGAIGNSALLLRSGFAGTLPAIGHGFYSHPQDMVFGVYDEPVDAFKGAFQALKSDDPEFRRQGFKLENVFGPPASIATLLPLFGREHAEAMRQFRHLGCAEVAVRDVTPGRISVDRRGRPRVDKRLGAEDLRRREAGLTAVRKVLQATGARRILPGQLSFGLHLMGGCALGADARTSVVGPSFMVHGQQDLFIADSSIFPRAPGINPSLTIMAMSLKAAESIKAHGV